MPASQIYQSAPVILNNAGILALPTGAGIEIVPALGSGKTFQFLSGLIKTNTVAGAYGNIQPGALAYFRVGDRVVSVRIMEATVGQLSIWLGTEWESLLFFSPFVQVNVLDEQVIVPEAQEAGNYSNQPINFAVSNYDGGLESHVDFTGGDAANTMELSALYTIIDV